MLVRNEEINRRVIEVITREELEGIKSAAVENERVDLGVVKSFSKNENLKAVLDDASQIFLSWVRLEAGQVLETHTHPIDSMYIMCEGNAILQGATTEEIFAGDVVIIPKGELHGFTGGGPNGYWALSVQFEMSGIYDSSEQPLVNFTVISTEDPTATLSVQTLMDKNEAFGKRFDKNPIFPALFDLDTASTEAKHKFLSYFQILSDHFQKMMLLRSSLCNHDGMSSVFGGHLKDEFGHHDALRESRGSSSREWDPVYDATCAWFSHQMLTCDDRERLFLVNYIIEESASIFYQKISKVFEGMGVSHFDSHAELDEAHNSLGANFLEKMDYYSLERLASLQEHGWSMVECQYRRLAEIAKTCMHTHS